jgi:ABC-type antimicrobial peptide transport system permease subunit
MTLPSPRYEWYLSDNFDVIQKKITDYTNNFMDKIGFYPVLAQFFIMKDMEGFSLGILFVHLVFDIVLVIFIIISVLLIYSLLMIGVETKTMETGIMRMVGLSKMSFVGMVILQSIMFALPAIVTGFILIFPLLAITYT